MSQGGANSSKGSGGDPIETLSGNSGGAVSPDGSFNIDILGNNVTGINIVGTPASNLLTVIGLAASTIQVGTVELATAIETGTLTDTIRAITPDALEPILVTPFVVAPGGAYTTIQSAIDAANTAGGGMVWVRNGSFTEDLTFFDNIFLVGDSEQGTFITGTHTPPSTGALNIFRLTFTDETAIFSSVAAGSATIICQDLTVNVTNGYTFDLVNWTGEIAVDNIGNAGTNDGFINNTGGATFGSFFSGLGIGSVNPMIVSGITIITTSDTEAPINFTSSATLEIDNCSFDNFVSFEDNCSGTIANTRISSGVVSTVRMDTSSDITLANVALETSNNPCISGTGAGTLNLSTVTFLDNDNVAGTVNLGYPGPTEVGTLFAQNISFDRGTNTVDTDGELIIGSTGLNPVISTLTAGTNITITNGAGSITIDSTGGTANLNVTFLTTASSPYTVLADDQYLSCDVGGGTLTIEMPNAPATGRVITVKDSMADAASNNITVTTVGGSVLIDGSTTRVISTDFEALQFIFNGTAYEVF